MSAAQNLIQRGPVRAAERTLAPDLARGMMLLLIALANTPWYLYGSQPGSSSVHPADGSGLDRAVQAMIITTVDMRVYPMFAFLFGYGMVQLFRRQLDAGTSERTARRILRRRNLWLILFGLVDAALFWMGDVLGAYGLAGLILVGVFFHRRDKTLLVWAGIWTGVLALFMILSVVGGVFAARADAPAESFNFYAFALGVAAEPNYLVSLTYRLPFWAVLSLLQGVLTLVVPIMVLLAFWAARQQVLERPADHLPLLRRVAVVGIGVGWLGGLPHALHHVGLLSVPDQASFVFGTTQSLTGMFGGLGYVALFGLIGHALTQRAERREVAHGVVVGALTAVGRRSLSCYLAQSVLCAPLLSAWGLGLGAVLGSATTALFAIMVWSVTVVGAWLLEQRGLRGPAEVALRRLSYRGLS